jgi:hypothetical protein
VNGAQLLPISTGQDVDLGPLTLRLLLRRRQERRGISFLSSGLVVRVRFYLL